MTLEDGVDRWPTFELSPTDYERAVADLVRAADQEVTDWQVQHLDPVEGVDGTYVIDVTVRFRLLGADFLTLFECKRQATPVKRRDVQELRDKKESIGAHKAFVVAASGFQRGALEYAKIHKIACVRLVDGAWTYETRDRAAAIPQPTGRYVAFARYLTGRGYGNTLLSGEPEHLQNAIFES